MITISNVDELIGIYSNIGHDMIFTVTENNETTNIDISTWPVGIYFIVIKNKHKLATKKFNKLPEKIKFQGVFNDSYIKS